MTIQEMREVKERCGYSNARLSELSGVPEATIQKILSGATRNPRYDTLTALEKALRSDSDSVFKEEAAEYGIRPPYTRQGTYTAADRDTLPEDIRTELIDGVLYDMASPTPRHQIFGGDIYYQIMNYIRSKGGSCIPFTAPLDVRLDSDDRTVVQPDVFILCDPSKLKNGWIHGAPDFVLEVLSPSTRKKDMYLKLAKYENAGVREYWMIDLKTERVLVYFFEDDSKCPVIYGLEDRIPVNIYSGELEIDLASAGRWLPDGSE